MTYRTEFYEMSMWDNDALEFVKDYEKGEVDARIFGRGQPYGAPLPKEIRITLGKGTPRDVFLNPFRFILASRRMVEAVKDLVSDHLEVLPITVVSDGQPTDRFVFIEPLAPIDAIKGEVTKTTLMTFPDSVTLDGSKIPPDRHFFRLQRLLTPLIVSREFIDRLKSNKLTGFEFEKVKVE